MTSQFVKRCIDPRFISGRYLSTLGQVLQRVSDEALGQVLDVLLEAERSGHRVYVMGNGGSAATASHFVADLGKTARVEGHRPLRAFALTDNVPSVTAWANDTQYERIFAEQIEALVERGDVVIGISASGNSPDIVAGLEAAAERGATTVALVGFDGGRATRLAQVVVHVPSHDYGRVEDAHMAIGHALTVALKQATHADGGPVACRPEDRPV